MMMILYVNCKCMCPMRFKQKFKITGGGGRRPDITHLATDVMKLMFTDAMTVSRYLEKVIGLCHVI
jgi:hypothetical protein